MSSSTGQDSRFSRLAEITACSDRHLADAH